MIVKTKRGDLPVRYGMNALATFGDLTGKSMNEVMESLTDLGEMKISEVFAFIYAGFKDGARHGGVECLIKQVSEVGDMMDEEPDLISKMTDIFLNDSTADTEIVEKDGGKKK